MLVDGAALDPKWRDALDRGQGRRLADAAGHGAVRHHATRRATNVDTHPLQLGKDLEIKARRDRRPRRRRRIFKGQIAAVEPEFDADGVRHLDPRLRQRRTSSTAQRKTRTFQQMSASDMVKKVAGEAGLSPKVASTDVVHEFFQQSNETDWDFLWRLALMHDYEVVVDDTTLEFRPANKGDGARRRADAGRTRCISFRPRMSGVQQPETVDVRGWDPKTKKVVTGTASSAQTTSQPGVAAREVSNDLGGGTTAVADRVVDQHRRGQRARQVDAPPAWRDAFFEADGVAFGNPKIKAGAKVKIAGRRHASSAAPSRSRPRRTLPRRDRLPDHFQISGRSARTLLELMRPARGARLVGLARGRRRDQQQRPGRSAAACA